MWIYQTATGKLWQDQVFIGTSLGSAAPAVVFIGICYSGHGLGLNNPNLENVHDVGPIPRGEWSIMPAITYGGLGEVVMKLMPKGQTITFNRIGFFIHGDEAQRDHGASHGCIVADRWIRERIANSKDYGLRVI